MSWRWEAKRLQNLKGKLSLSCSMKMGVGCDWEEGSPWDQGEVGMPSPPKDGDVISTVPSQPSKAYENVTGPLHASAAGSLAWLGAWPMAGGQWPRAQGSQLVTG